jgi:hypothetical protein
VLRRLPGDVRAAAVFKVAGVYIWQIEDSHENLEIYKLLPSKIVLEIKRDALGNITKYI